VAGFLKLDVMLCLNHCRSAPLNIPPVLHCWPPYLPSILRLLVEKPRAWAVAQALALSSGGVLALALPPTLGCPCASLWPGPVLLLKRILLTQAPGFRHHLLSLLSAQFLALGSRWPLLLALGSRWPLVLTHTSCQSIPIRQFASTSLQSSFTTGLYTSSFCSLTSNSICACLCINTQYPLILPFPCSAPL
jgi:hypothetical protein